MQKSVKNIRGETNIKKQTCVIVKDEYCRLIGIMMNLMSKDDEYAQVQYKQDIKRHGDKAVKAMFKECRQLGDSNKASFIPFDISRLSEKQKREALRMLALIKKKRSGKVKGRIVSRWKKIAKVHEERGCGITYSEPRKLFDYVSG